MANFTDTLNLTHNRMDRYNFNLKFIVRHVCPCVCLSARILVKSDIRFILEYFQKIEVSLKPKTINWYECRCVLII
jgi:hypothetical protein